MTIYDRLASSFDRQRPLPEDVPNAIRSAVLAELPARPNARPALTRDLDADRSDDDQIRLHRYEH
jgi:hypothetical protein